MERGYVRLWRKSIESGWLKNKNAWIFWTWCLMKANHQKDFKQVVGFQEVTLQPGDFIFGLNKAAEETFLSVQNIRTCLTFLKKSQNLTIKTTNKFSIISITNWDSYQYSEDAINTQSNKRLTNNQQTTNNKQEHKNIRTDKEEIYSRVVNYLNKKTNSDFKPTTKKTMELINARTKEGFTPDNFKTVIDFKCSQWLKDGERQEYLRPITLFSSKFEGYLNAAKRECVGTMPKKETPEDAAREIREALL